MFLKQIKYYQRKQPFNEKFLMDTWGVARQPGAIKGIEKHAKKSGKNSKGERDREKKLASSDFPFPGSEKRTKIPDVYNALGIKYLRIADLIGELNWSF